MIIPDTIQPYLGIKALEIRGDTLHSPQRGTQWPKRQRLEATCRYRAIEWGLRDTPAGWDQERFWVPASVLRQGETTNLGWPTVPAPKGKTWVPHEVEHQLDRCAGPCGIYVVDTPEQCETYLHSHSRRVLASVALWGQVVIGERGARGQYAYPIRLVGPWQWEQEIAAAAAAYEIQHTVVEAQTTPDVTFAQLLRQP